MTQYLSKSLVLTFCASSYYEKIDHRTNYPHLAKPAKKKWKTPVSMFKDLLLFLRYPMCIYQIHTKKYTQLFSKQYSVFNICYKSHLNLNKLTTVITSSTFTLVVIREDITVVKICSSIVFYQKMDSMASIKFKIHI